MPRFICTYDCSPPVDASTLQNNSRTVLLDAILQNITAARTSPQTAPSTISSAPPTPLKRPRPEDSSR